MIAQTSPLRLLRAAGWAALLGCGSAALAAGVVLDLETARLALDSAGRAELTFADGTAWPVTPGSAMELEAGGSSFPVRTVEFSGERLRAQFENGARADFRVTCGRGFALFQLAKLETPAPAERFRLFQLAAPLPATTSGQLNGADDHGRFAAVMAARLNVHAFNQHSGGAHLDRAGCEHELAPVTPGRVGRRAAQFSARCDGQAGGWSMSGREFPAPLDLSGCRALRVWIHGDGRGEALKVQLYDGAGGYRDNYVTIDFTGWRRVTLTNCPINTLRYDRVTTLNLYYNGLPASTAVTCRVDHLEALLEREDGARTVVLEDFEDPASALWSPAARLFCVETARAHGLEPAAFGVLACRAGDFPETVQRFEAAAELPRPRPGGVWSKQSPRVRRSYLFLTSFRESQLDQGLALARRGGFDTILLGQESWSDGTGHYEINRRNFPDGLEGLKRTLARFRAEGFHVGLHFLAASIYPPDRYLTPVPDPRLVKGAAAVLAADIDAAADRLPLAAPPAGFPDEDGGYEGRGTVAQIGDELVHYAAKTSGEPWALEGCRRGHLGTRPAAHAKGETVRHLVRAYGYHLYDLDSSLLEEVAGNFARVADACGIDMIYFDGSERLQGDHWYYNARLHDAFYRRLANPDTLLQASSFSHYSWHLMARSASADGHGDLKGYLDQRSGGFDWLARDWMPLDIGWYYGYDPSATPDQFEYVLAAALGYNSSMSFQVSCGAAAAHPFTGEILDLIGRYERLRLSGRLPETLRAKLRIDPALTAVKPGQAQPDLLEKRREYRLIEKDGREFFQRVAYEPWREIKPADAAAAVWPLQVKTASARPGVQIHAPKGTEVVDPWVEIGGRRWEWTGRLAAGQFLFLPPGGRATRHAPGLEPPETGPAAPDVRLDSGEHTARFGAREFGPGPVRVRLTLELPERLEF